MRLKNTSNRPDDEVRSLVEFAMKGVRTERLAVNVKNGTRGSSGMAYDHTPDMSPTRKLKTVDMLVTLHIGPDSSFPRSNEATKWDPSKVSPGGYVLRKLGHGYGGKRSPLFTCVDWRETLVAIAAHEARHIYQYLHDKRRSEVDAERYALKRLEAYRATLVAAVPA